jgi:hypothetical protein
MVMCWSTISSRSWKPMCCVLARRKVVLVPTYCSNPLVTPPLNRTTASCASISPPRVSSSSEPPLPTMAQLRVGGGLRVSRWGLPTASSPWRKMAVLMPRVEH